ncbi:MAG TPA: hypothetical protein VFB72_00585 [Verrucomicrobiae bacterium]|nr:hypothetical protein [Verrucomicrobiae bacterium]
MNNPDGQLNRLLKSAAAAPKAPSGAAAFVLEARVLARWRASRVNEDEGDFLVAWFRRAAICGCVLAIASLAWVHQESTDFGGGAMAVADSAMQMGVEP